MSVRILHGDCRDVLATLPDASVDACVTDPPYGLAFMGKRWDHGAPGVEFWLAVHRVLKPGAHLLAFGGTRTVHRLACAIEDAGFEVRDMIAWVYGSGFPKSLDVSKAIDKAAGVRDREPCGGLGSARSFADDAWTQANQGRRVVDIPRTAAAAAWKGWGTALKPAMEPIVVARKPLDGTVAANVLRHGTGALNIDGCRVGWAGTEDAAAAAAAAAVGFADSRARGTAKQSQSIGKESRDGTNRYDPDSLVGRWPANLIHDGSDEVVALFPGDAEGKDGFRHSATSIFGSETRERTYNGESRSSFGSAARFFYTAKADADERNGSKHPTVKPLDLMRYLVRLVTPLGGLVLDPFAGTGTTGQAALMEGMRTILIERDADYLADIERRLSGTQLGLTVQQGGPEPTATV